MPRWEGKGEWGWQFLRMLTHGNAGSSGNVTMFCVRRGRLVPTAIYSYVCVCVRAAFEFSVSTVYVNGHVNGLSGVVVTLTLTEGLS